MTEHVKAEWDNSACSLPDGSYINGDGDVCYIKNGKWHREDGPAIEKADGDEEWLVNGELHREDGPAVEYANGTKKWYKNGKQHREDGPAVTCADGYKAWYKNGKHHREDGPAVICANDKMAWWMSRCVIHDGQAIIWYIDGKEYGTKKEYEEALKIWKMNEAMK